VLHSITPHRSVAECPQPMLPSSSTVTFCSGSEKSTVVYVSRNNTVTVEKFAASVDVFSGDRLQCEAPYTVLCWR